MSCAFSAQLAHLNDYIETMRVVPRKVSRILFKNLYDENAKIYLWIYIQNLQK